MWFFKGYICVEVVVFYDMEPRVVWLTKQFMFFI